MYTRGYGSLPMYTWYIGILCTPWYIGTLCTPGYTLVGTPVLHQRVYLLRVVTMRGEHALGSEEEKPVGGSLLLSLGS